MTTQFDSRTIVEIEKSLKMAIGAVADHFGITIDISSPRWNGEMFRATIEGKTKIRAAQDDVFSPREFKDGTPFVYMGTRYTVCGFKPKGRKFQYVATGPQGGRWKFTAAIIRAGKVA